MTIYKQDEFPIGTGYPVYAVVYADPPWTYRDKARAGERGVEYKYPCLTVQEIMDLPVGRIVAFDSTLFLWVTWPMLREGLEVMRAWGFEYRTCAFNWVKKNKVSDSLFWGMGNWTRANSEVCLLGVRGRPERYSAGEHQVVGTEVVYSPVEGHSKKPNLVRDRIVRLCGDVPRIELFARECVDGWDCWGNGL